MQLGLFLLIGLLAAAAVHGEVGHESSVQAYVTAAHKRAFDAYSLLAYGTTRLTKSAIRGSVGVVGAATFEEFDIGRDIAQCNPSAPALSVTGVLTARMGQVHNGYVLGGSGSTISHSVRRACSPMVKKFTDVNSLNDLEISLIRDSGETCSLPKTADTEKLNASTTIFKPAQGSYSCYSVFEIDVDDLTTAKEWQYQGNSTRNLIIKVGGRGATLQDFKMTGFNAARTLIVFCSHYGTLQLMNARLHSSILSPTTAITAMGSIVNGSIVSGSIRGEIAILQNTYEPC